MTWGVDSGIEPWHHPYRLTRAARRDVGWMGGGARASGKVAGMVSDRSGLSRDVWNRTLGCRKVALPDLMYVLLICGIEPWISSFRMIGCIRKRRVSIPICNPDGVAGGYFYACPGIFCSCFGAHETPSAYSFWN